MSCDVTSGPCSCGAWHTAYCRNCIGTGLDMFNQACPCGTPPGTVGVVPVNNPYHHEIRYGTPQVGMLAPEQPPITIEDVKRLVVNPGEALLVRMPDNSTTELMRRASKVLNETFKGVKILLYKGETEFTVVVVEPEKPDADKDDPEYYCGAV